MSQERSAPDSLGEDVPPAIQPTSGEPRNRHLPSLYHQDEGRGESPLCGSPFIQEIQDTPIPQHFRLPTLEAYDGGSDPMEHVVAFWAQMAFYGMSDAIMCPAFLTTLREIARGWYDRLPLASIHSLDQLAREFEANFYASAQPKPTVASLRMRQKEDEHLDLYHAHFIMEIKAFPTRIQSREPSLHPKGPAERQIDVIVGGPAVGGDSSSTGKAYARAEVQKRPRARCDPKITFKSESEYPNHDDALVITARIANARIKCIMIDIP
ncbi:hypothetical protein B296_00022158 [Ensete ventricosum]|uniref:Retrotransposon gag domain-containing protein n=1 Tax=Ensete ventricosum TaxID=4639 RepID=A0A427AUN9_ENSVE|nr:hypothetical protein B296_00022158 [Ensete ventricosum]